MNRTNLSLPIEIVVGTGRIPGVGLTLRPRFRRGSSLQYVLASDTRLTPNFLLASLLRLPYRRVLSTEEGEVTDTLKQACSKPLICEVIKRIHHRTTSRLLLRSPNVEKLFWRSDPTIGDEIAIEAEPLHGMGRQSIRPA